MKSMLKYIIFSNLAVFLVVYIFESYTLFLGIKYWSDYAFITLLIIWIIAGYLFANPPSIVDDVSDEYADHSTSKMVDFSNSNNVDNLRNIENDRVCFKLFIAGLPTLVIALILRFFALTI